MSQLSTDVANAALSDFIKEPWKKDCVKEIRIWGRG